MQYKKNLDSSHGFSLVELVVVLAIIGVVFVGATVGLSAFRQTADLTVTENKIANIKEQLLNFVAVNYYLPCPDTDGDGFENRTSGNASYVINPATGSFAVNRCSRQYGTVPYLDIGLELEQVEDEWSYPVSYFVNQNTDVSDDICDKNKVASYFCNAHAMTTPRFTLEDTPPLANIANPWNTYASGDYTVCNDNTASCQTSAVNAANNQDNVAVLSAAIVLVAHNQDGAEAVNNIGSCSYTNSASQENCDQDRFFHRIQKTDTDNDYFDDVIETISGYEIKSRALNTILSWQSGGGVTDTFDLMSPTESVYDLDDAADITLNDDEQTPDALLVNRNLNDGINMGAGDDMLAVGNNIDAGTDIVDMGTGNDFAYAAGNILSDLVLGEGDDRVVLEGNLDSNITGGNGSDKIWVLGTISSSGSIDLGGDDDVVWFGGQVYDDDGNPLTEDIASDLSGNINGGEGYDIVILEEVDSYSDLSADEKASLQGFELIMFKSLDDSGTRNYCTPTESGCT